MSEGQQRRRPRARRAGAGAEGAAPRQETRPQRQGGTPPSGGGIRIEDAVVAKVAAIAVQEVDGVRAGGATPRSVGGLLSSAGGRGEPAGISVEVGEVEAAADVTLAVAYGMPIPQISEAVRRNVVNRIENLAGLRVTEVNVFVNDLFFPEHERLQQQSQGDGGL